MAMRDAKTFVECEKCGKSVLKKGLKKHIDMAHGKGQKFAFANNELFDKLKTLRKQNKALEKEIQEFTKIVESSLTADKRLREYCDNLLKRIEIIENNIQHNVLNQIEVIRQQIKKE